MRTNENSSEASTENSIVWDPVLDIHLLQSMVGLRPIGIHRNLRMMNIYLRFTQKLNDENVSIEQLWDRIKEWYNLDVLEDLEIDSDTEDSEVNELGSKSVKRGANASDGKYYSTKILLEPDIDYEDRDFWQKETEFVLPWDEYGAMMLERAVEGVNEDEEAPYSSPAEQELESQASIEMTPELEEEGVRRQGLILPSLQLKMTMLDTNHDIVNLPKNVEAPFPIYLESKVISGYGRGGKELGIPTANMCEQAVEQALDSVSTGIYFGLCKIESEDVIRPMVMSLGWNLFYKNKKRSIEAHIIHKYEQDFYGQEISTLILGYIRPERDYNGRESLIKDIKADIDFALKALELPEYSKANGEGTATEKQATESDPKDLLSSKLAVEKHNSYTRQRLRKRQRDTIVKKAKSEYKEPCLSEEDVPVSDLENDSEYMDTDPNYTADTKKNVKSGRKSKTKKTKYDVHKKVAAVLDLVDMNTVQNHVGGSSDIKKRQGVNKHFDQESSIVSIKKTKQIKPDKVFQDTKKPATVPINENTTKKHINMISESVNYTQYAVKHSKFTSENEQKALGDVIDSRLLCTKTIATKSKNVEKSVEPPVPKNHISNEEKPDEPNNHCITQGREKSCFGKDYEELFSFRCDSEKHEKHLKMELKNTHQNDAGASNGGSHAFEALSRDVNKVKVESVPTHDTENDQELCTNFQASELSYNNNATQNKCSVDYKDDKKVRFGFLEKLEVVTACDNVDIDRTGLVDSEVGVEGQEKVKYGVLGVVSKLKDNNKSPSVRITDRSLRRIRRSTKLGKMIFDSKKNVCITPTGDLVEKGRDAVSVLNNAETTEYGSSALQELDRNSRLISADKPIPGILQITPGSKHEKGKEINTAKAKTAQPEVARNFIKTQADNLEDREAKVLYEKTYSDPYTSERKTVTTLDENERAANSGDPPADHQGTNSSTSIVALNISASKVMNIPKGAAKSKRRESSYGLKSNLKSQKKITRLDILGICGQSKAFEFSEKGLNSAGLIIRENKPLADTKNLNGVGSVKKINEADFSEVFSAYFDTSIIKNQDRGTLDDDFTFADSGIPPSSRTATNAFPTSGIVEAAVKIIPFGEPKGVSPSGGKQTTLRDLYQELVSTLSLSWMADKERVALLESRKKSLVEIGANEKALGSNFVKAYRICVFQGKFPKNFISAWEDWKKENTELCRNVHPKRYSSTQMYAVLILEYGGEPLETVKLTTWKQAQSILRQLTLSLALAEHLTSFEHRDLHWGNILVKKCDYQASFLYRRLRLSSDSKNPSGFGLVRIPSHGVQCTIIDYTLSRLDITLYSEVSKSQRSSLFTSATSLDFFGSLSPAYQNRNSSDYLFYVNLKDPALFKGVGDIQYDIYRQMQRLINNGDWSQFTPKSNVLVSPVFLFLTTRAYQFSNSELI
ncbi:Riboflavin kinase [Zancudomyces culisetae]|uniref:Flavin mononucleotide kinase 1 n=1 Tax=Zancudomyces culisetae TaxID=1213189 RepID=A0A1R1PM52_ZANCU|nr:Riboflavin kinase [Zancudomyces culisetae]|eukprot:OMH82050.1 Riboflavin kinase [Zancudomyces culisetae]